MTSMGGSIGKGGAGGCSSPLAGAAVSDNVEVVGPEFRAGAEEPAFGGGLASRGADWGEGSRMTSIEGSMGTGGAGGCSSPWARAAVSGNVEVAGPDCRAGAEAPGACGEGA